MGADEAAYERQCSQQKAFGAIGSMKMTARTPLCVKINTLIKLCFVHLYAHGEMTFLSCECPAQSRRNVLTL